MGDRSNVIIIHDKMQPRVITTAGKIPMGAFYVGVGIYTHWCGATLPSMVKSALRKAKDRWDDPSYCTRILFDDLLTQSGSHDQATGWGLYPYMGEVRGEESRETIYVNLYDNTVSIGEKTWESLKAFANEPDPPAVTENV